MANIWKRRVGARERRGVGIREVDPTRARGEARRDRVQRSLRGRTSGLDHFHHGAEELLVVLGGAPTLRSPGGESLLGEGDVVLFPVGPDGAHQLLNRTDTPVRFLFVANRPSPEVVEYPDTRQLSAMALTDSQLGGPLWDIRTLEAPAGE